WHRCINFGTTTPTEDCHGRSAETATGAYWLAGHHARLWRDGTAWCPAGTTYDRSTGRNHPQRSARCRHQLHRYLNRLRRERRANRPLHLASTIRVLLGEEMWLSGGRGYRPRRPGQSARLYTR